MLHIITGPPLAGKTTYARRHALGAPVIDFDDIVEQLGGTRYAPTPRIRAAALTERRRRIDTALTTNTDAWIIHSRPSPDDTARYAAAGATFHLIDPGPDTIRRRLHERPPEWVDLIDAWYADPPQLPGHPGTRPTSGGQRSAPEGTTMTTTTPAPAAPSPDGPTPPANNGPATPPVPTPPPAYTPPATQAELDRIIASRLERERAKFADYDELKQAKARLDEIEDRDKSELQRAIEQNERLQRELDDARARSLRAEVATAKGVPAELLHGGTREELEQAADRLIEFRGTKTAPVVPTEGTSPTGPAASGDWLRAGLARR